MANEVEVTEFAETQMMGTESEKDQEEETTLSSDPTEPEVTEEEEHEQEEELPPLTYVDFLPQSSFGAKLAGSDPVYESFQTVVEQANQWLRSTPEFIAVKCETVDYKLNSTDHTLQPDSCLQHFASNGKNVYVKGLRLWLMPRTDQTMPVQQLGYITVLPDHSSGDLMTTLKSIQPGAMRFNADQLLGEFDALNVTVEKLNHHLRHKPLPGRILTVETLCLKALESDGNNKFDAENTLWSENGRATRLFLFATRIFYVMGPPAFEKLCYYDEVPNVQQNLDFDLGIKFSPFSHTVASAARWLRTQKNMRTVNFQSVTLKLQRPGSVGLFRINPEAPGFTESQHLQESRYVKILRVFYLREQKAEVPSLFQSMHLTTRLFVPTKADSAGSFETFSKTVQRIITWLKATGVPVLGMETIRYSVNPEHGQGVNSERVDSVVNAYSGKHSLTCVRLFFPCEFQEPPPEEVAETEEDYWGWMCVVS